MKKILVFLLILAVGAGTVFAQDAEAGTFTWTGEFRFGTDLILPSDDPTTPDDPALKPSNGYGQATLSYDKGALNTELIFRADKLNNLGTVTGLAEYGDGVNSTESNFKVKGKLTLLSSVSVFAAPDEVAGADAYPDPSWRPAELYAYYKFLNSQLKFDVAYRGYDNDLWHVSDLVTDGKEWGNFNEQSGIRLNYTPTFLSGLSAGVRLPIWDKVEFADGYINRAVYGVRYDVPHLFSVSAMVKAAPNKGQSADLGLKFVAIPNASPDPIYPDDETLAISADFEAQNLGDFSDFGLFQAGAKAEYIARPLTAGLKLILDGAPGELTGAWNAARNQAIKEAYEAQFKSGGTVYFNEYGDFVEAIGETTGSVVGLTLDELVYGAGGLRIDSDAQDATPFFFYLKPYVFFDIVPYTLQARLDTTVAISISDAFKDMTVLVLEPALYWNMKGDKVTDDMASGLLVKYSVGYEFDTEQTLKNQLSLNFRWSF